MINNIYLKHCNKISYSCLNGTIWNFWSCRRHWVCWVFLFNTKIFDRFFQVTCLPLTVNHPFSRYIDLQLQKIKTARKNETLIRILTVYLPWWLNIFQKFNSSIRINSILSSYKFKVSQVHTMILLIRRTTLEFFVHHRNKLTKAINMDEQNVQ